MGNEISKEQLYIYMGALLGHQDKNLNQTVSQAIDISVALIGDYIYGRLVPADMVGTEVPKPAPEELKEPEPVYANNETVDDYLPGLNKEE